MAGLVPRLSGSIFLGKAHGIDSNHFQSLATRVDMKGISAVPHTNTVFRDVLKLLPWSAFERLVEERGTDELVRSFTTKRQLTALLFGQLSGAHSLRDIEASMASHQGRLYHAGGAAPARSTFSRRMQSIRPLPTLTATAIPGFSRIFSSPCWAWRRAACAARWATRRP
jgi:hypothetical protein